MSNIEENEIIINSELLNNDFDDLAFEPETIKGDEMTKNLLLNMIIN